MKHSFIYIVNLVLLGWMAVPSYLHASSLELENRISMCTSSLNEMLNSTDGGIPADLLRRSTGIIIFPQVLKAGLGVGGHYGKGVILRRYPKSGKWGPPVFISLIGGSIGWQVGIQATDLVLLIMSDVSLKSLFQNRFTIGADASVAAGPVGRDASAGTDIDLSQGMLSYSRAKGLFIGLSIKGSVIEVDWQANESYYGSDLSIIDIFFKGKGKVSPSAKRLIHLLNKNTK
jgi:lipid-binding SYLF domain-containing protein